MDPIELQQIWADAKSLIIPNMSWAKIENSGKSDYLHTDPLETLVVLKLVEQKSSASQRKRDNPYEDPQEMLLELKQVEQKILIDQEARENP